MARITFRVNGTPQTQGSIRAFTNRKTGRAILTSDNSKLKPWRKLVAEAAANALKSSGLIMIDCPVIVDAEFVIPRLSSHPKTSRGAVPIADKRPDLDKLCRGLNDALMDGKVISEDSRIIELNAKKRYANIGELPGAYVQVSTDVSSRSSETRSIGKRGSVSRP